MKTLISLFVLPDEFVISQGFLVISRCYKARPQQKENYWFSAGFLPAIIPYRGEKDLLPKGHPDIDIP